MRFFLYFLGRSVCHQIPERSFFIHNIQFPLCARCTGIYTGMFMGFLYILIRKRHKGNKPPSIKYVILMIIFLLPMIIDGLTSYLGFRSTNNNIRIITGLMFGVIIPVFIVLISNFDVQKHNTLPIIKNYMDILGMLLTIILPFFLIHFEHVIIWWLIASVSVLIIPFIYVKIFYIILKNLFSSLKKKQVYFVASLFYLIFMVSLSLMNKFFLVKFR